MCAAIASRCSCRSRWNCPIAHMAAFRSGMVSIPLFALFGEDALEFRLANSGARAIVTDESGWEKLAKIRDRLPDLANVYVIGDAAQAGAKSFWASLKAASAEFATVDTSAEDPGADHLYLGHHGKSQGRAACASRAARPSAECRDVPRFPAQARRSDVDAGRLGLDRRADQRAVRGLVSRRADRRPPRPQVRAAGGDADDGRLCHPQRVPAADRAEADAAGRRQPRRRQVAQHLHRRRVAGRRVAGVGARHLRHRRA